MTTEDDLTPEEPQQPGPAKDPAIAAHCGESAEAIKAALMTDLTQFMGGTPLQDDVTLLVLKQK